MKEKRQSKIVRSKKVHRVWLSSSLVFGLALNVSCARPNGPETVRWSRHQEGRLDAADRAILEEQVRAALATETQANPGHQVSLGQLRVQRWQPTVAGVPIANAFVQKVETVDGELSHISAEWPRERSPEEEQSLLALVEREPQIRERLRQWYPEFRQASRIFPVQYRLDRETGRSTRPLAVYTFMLSDETDVVEYHVNESGYRVVRQSVAYRFVDGIAKVFSGPPTEVNLAEVTLKGLLGDGTLSSPNLRVQSLLESTQRPDHRFFYSPNEPGFNVAQTYFTVRRTMDWFQTEYGISLPFNLDVRVHVGGHQPRNVNFYYPGNIRLGDGDGSTYRQIPRDPTIVSHEVAHAFIDAVAGLPWQGEGGTLNEGFADFFSANINGIPKMGSYSYLKRPFVRSIENDMKVSDFSGALYRDSLVVSGTLWDIRKVLGANATGHLALKILAHLGPNGQFADFSASVHNALVDGSYNAVEISAVDRVLESRGWKSY